jgi:hypothetical protein
MDLKGHNPLVDKINLEVTKALNEKGFKRVRRIVSVRN